VTQSGIEPATFRLVGHCLNLPLSSLCSSNTLLQRSLRRVKSVGRDFDRVRQPTIRRVHVCTVEGGGNFENLLRIAFDTQQVPCRSDTGNWAVKVLHHTTSNITSHYVKYYITLRQILHHTTSNITSHYVKYYITLRQILHHATSNITSRYVKYYITLRQILHHATSNITSRYVKYYITLRQILHNATSNITSRYVKYYITLRQILHHATSNITSHYVKYYIGKVFVADGQLSGELKKSTISGHTRFSLCFEDPNR